MKREILCQSCGDEARRRHRFDADGFASPYPGEYVRLVSGTLKPRQEPEQIKIYTGAGALDRTSEPTEVITMAADEYICDACSAPMQIGQQAVARSIWVDGRRPYYQWEGDYFEQEQS